MTAEVNGPRSGAVEEDRRSGWGDMILQDIELLRLKNEDTGDTQK